MAGVALVAAILLPSRAAAAAGPAASSTPGATPARHAAPDVILSNETTSTTWTVADAIVPIRVDPSLASPAITKTRWETGDGFGLQSYLLLRQRRTGHRRWVELRIPMRPNGRVGWVPRSALDVFHHTDEQLVVNRASRRLTLYRAGRSIFTAPVGVGKPSTPTPPGHFWVTESFASTDPFYGPFAFGTSDYSTLSEWPGGGIVGLHGTNEPSLVPGDPSHGCVRLHNGDILVLKRLVSIGTPILIQ